MIADGKGVYQARSSLKHNQPVVTLLTPPPNRRDRLFAGMSRPSNTRVFISYAWKDDQPFVERLYKDLKRLGHDPWMDKKNMPSRGRTLPQEVIGAIDRAD